MKALSRDPDERFESADAMRKALRSPACLGGKQMAAAEDLAAVMQVLFGEERKERALAIQRKMAALNSGKRASDSGPVPRMSDASLVPPPPTSSIRLVRDLPPEDERRTALDGRKSSKPPDSDVRARELAVFEAARKQEDLFARASSPRGSETSTVIDLDNDADTRVDADFHIPEEAIPEEHRASFLAVSKDPLASGAWPSTINTCTEPMPERVASLPPPPSVPPPVPSLPAPSAVESTGPMRAAEKRSAIRLRRFAYFVTDVLVLTLVAVLGMRITGHRIDRAAVSAIEARTTSAWTTVASWATSTAEQARR